MTGHIDYTMIRDWIISVSKKGIENAKKLKQLEERMDLLEREPEDIEHPQDPPA